MTVNKISLSFVGSGNVATQLARNFFSKGIEIKSVFSPNYENCRALAESVDAEVLTSIEKVGDADVIVISVPDDKIENVVDNLHSTGSLVVHTSGITPLDVVSGKFKKSGVLYPLQTFSKSKNINLENVPFCIEATDENCLSTLKKLSSAVSKKIYEIDSNQRAYLHLAAVFVSNFVNFMYSAGYDIVTGNGMDFEMLKPLIKEVADKVMLMEPLKAQTGPAVRKDMRTLEKHRDLLQKNGEKKLLELYNLITESIIRKYDEL